MAYAHGGTVLYRSPNRKWTITRTNEGRIVVDDGLLTHWPIRYADGRVAWDYPYRIPAYVKEAAGRVWDAQGRSRDKDKPPGWRKRWDKFVSTGRLRRNHSHPTHPYSHPVTTKHRRAR